MSYTSQAWKRFAEVRSGEIVERMKRSGEMKLQQGQRLRLKEVEVFSRASESPHYVSVFYPGEVGTMQRVVSFPRDWIAEVLPEQIKVGDRVNSGGSRCLTVVALDGDMAWCKDGDYHALRPIPQLTKIVDPV